MASLSTISSLCYLNQNPNPLRFTSKASPCLRFGYLKTNEVRRVPVCRVSSKLVFPNLQADDFRHPVDLEDSRRYKANNPDWAEIEEAAKGIQAFCEPDLIENDGTSVLAGPTQHSDTYKLMAEAAEILNITTPLLYIRRNDVPLAHAVGLNPPYVTVHSRLLDLLTPQEQQAVFARELAHLKCGHYVFLRYMDAFVLALKEIPDSVIQHIPVKQMLRWAQATELSCDRASLLVAQDPKVVISAIMKLVGGFPTMVGEPDVDAYLAAARAYVAASSSIPTERFVNGLAREPAPLVRAYEIDEWSRSKEYATLLTSATIQGELALIKKNIIERLLEQVDMDKFTEKLLKQVDMEKFIDKLLKQVDIGKIMK